MHSNIKQQPGLAVPKGRANQDPSVTPAQGVPSAPRVQSHSTQTQQAEGGAGKVIH